MKKAFCLVSLLVLLAVSGCEADEIINKENTLSNKSHQKKAAEDIKQASLWIIEEGIDFYSKSGRKGIHRKLVDEWSASLWALPEIATEQYLARIPIQTRGIYYDIHNLHRQKIDGLFFEFWLIKISAKPWSGETPKSVFFVTQTDNINGKRQILVKNDQVIENYKVADGEIFSLPVNDLQLLYTMQAWQFPENYKHSNLKDKKVSMDSNGQIFLQ